MALRNHLLTPKLPTLRSPKPISRLSPSSTFLNNRTRKTLIKCSHESSADYSDLSSNLAKEVGKMNTLLAQRAEAMEKSREILFKELCQYLSMGSTDEVRRQWMKMEEEEKWVLVKGFVSDWGANFHPLSARSVKELIEEHLHGEEEERENGSSKSSSSSLFPSLKKMLWFSQNK